MRRRKGSQTPGWALLIRSGGMVISGKEGERFAWCGDGVMGERVISYRLWARLLGPLG